jgi:hypothetical protein
MTFSLRNAIKIMTVLFFDFPNAKLGIVHTHLKSIIHAFELL